MSERYRPLYKLDSGGMAEVYVAEAESMAGFKKKVAIKRILPDLVKDEKFVRMFLDEARLSLHLNHANIVSVFDIGKSSSTYFIVMEFVEGTNLKGLLQHLHRKRAVLPVHMTVWVLNEILKGLDYAHSLRDPETGRQIGIVHRDISPPNILMSWNGEIKLVDFGLAKASTQLESTDPGVVKGKFSYLAPEAAQGLEVDRRADIFAVGILGYEMLTGKRLFLGESDYKTVEMVRRAAVPSITTQNPEVTAELEKIVLRALTREPEERYQHASDFAEDLLGFLFSRSMKVSARDLADVMSELRQELPSVEESTAKGENLILRLIDDEFAEIRSLDAAEDSGPQTGSMPLQSLSDPFGFDPSAPLRLDDFGEDSPGDADPTPVPAPGSAPMSRPKRGTGPGPAAPAKRSGSALWVLLLLVVVAAGGGGYYWLIVMGNLSKFTG
jgi:serine/threonine-protein kinase